MGLTAVLSPQLNVELRNVNQPFRTWALVDSGADYSYLPHGAAKVLGVDPGRLVGKTVPVEGIGDSKIDARFCELEVRFLFGEHVEHTVDLPFLVPLEKTGADKPVLLGRHPLFSLYDVHFRMGYTDDPELGKWTLTEVTKRHGADKYRKGGMLPRR